MAAQALETLVPTSPRAARSVSFSLPGPFDDPTLVTDGDHDGDADHRTEPMRMLRLAIPLSTSSLCAFALSLVSLAFAGRLGENALSAAVLATSVFNVTGLSLIQGLNSALETFAGNAWGAGQFSLVGTWLQRSFLANTILTALVVAFWSHARAIFVFLGQEETLAIAAARYLQRMAIALLPAGIFEALKRVQGLSNPKPITIATTVALLASPAFNWALIYWFELGLDGAAFAVICVETTMALSLGLATASAEWAKAAAGDHRRIWAGWSMEVFKDWGQFLRLALPCIVMICAEWWTFEIVLISAGWLPKPETAVGVMGVCMNLSGLIWTFISGIAFAVSARVAISLGAGLPSLAKRAAKLGLIMALAVECIAALLALAGRRHLAEIFTSAEQVTTSVAAVIPAFALGLLPDGANCVLQGVLRGAGKQSLGAWTTVASYWFIGLPFCYYLAFHRGLQELGLWLGIAATNAVQCIVMLTVITRLDFDAASKTAMRRGALAAIEGREIRNEEERGMSTVPLLEEDSECT